MTIDTTSHMRHSETLQTKGVSARVPHLVLLALLFAVLLSGTAWGQFDSASVLGTI